MEESGPGTPQVPTELTAAEEGKFDALITGTPQTTDGEAKTQSPEEVAAAVIEAKVGTNVLTKASEGTMQYQFLNTKTALDTYGIVLPPFGGPRVKVHGLFHEDGIFIACNELANMYGRGLLRELSQQVLKEAKEEREATIGSSEDEGADEQGEGVGTMKMDEVVTVVVDEELKRLGSVRGSPMPYSKATAKEMKFIKAVLRGFTREGKMNPLLHRMAYRYALMRTDEADTQGNKYYSNRGIFGTLMLAAQFELADRVRCGEQQESYVPLYSKDRNWMVLVAYLLAGHLDGVHGLNMTDINIDEKLASEPSDRQYEYQVKYWVKDRKNAYKLETATEVAIKTGSKAEFQKCLKVVESYKKMEKKYFEKEYLGDHVGGLAIPKDLIGKVASYNEPIPLMQRLFNADYLKQHKSWISGRTQKRANLVKNASKEVTSARKRTKREGLIRGLPSSKKKQT